MKKILFYILRFLFAVLCVVVFNYLTVLLFGFRLTGGIAYALLLFGFWALGGKVFSRLNTEPVQPERPESKNPPKKII